MITSITRSKDSSSEMNRFTGLTSAKIKMINILFIIVFHAGLINAQNKYTGMARFGGGIDLAASCNGHGAFYAPHLSIYKHNYALSFGPLIHKRSGIVNSVKVTFSRNLTGAKNRHMKDEYFYNYHYPDLLQLNFYSTLQYNGKLPLSYANVKEEELVNREPQPDFNRLRMATAEVSSGIAFQVNFTNAISWKSYIGLACYYHLNYLKGLDHERTGAVISAGTSISFIIPN